jgi:MerR family transcriptional regulator, copper efflux regulator
MRITEAARLLGTSPRMLRYRDTLGLLPGLRSAAGSATTPLRAATPHGATTPRVGTTPHDATTSRSATTPRVATTSRGATTSHRQFSEADLDAVALALAIEHRYDISPAALAFGLRVLAEPPVRAEVAELARRIGRVPAPAARALDFEQERALRLLSMPRRPHRPAQPETHRR